MPIICPLAVLMVSRRWRQCGGKSAVDITTTTVTVYTVQVCISSNVFADHAVGQYVSVIKQKKYLAYTEHTLLLIRVFIYKTKKYF